MKNLVAGIHKFKQDSFTQDQELFETLAQGQHPTALFITCSDSRIDPNLLTQTKPGELFIQRTAGNIVPPYGSVFAGEAATIEYAVAALKIEHIVICGHSHCGAMAGLLAPELTERMPAVRAYLQHAESTRRIIEENHSQVTDQERRLALTIEANVLVQLENLRTHPSVAAAVGRGDLQLHGWTYKFESGDVLAYHPTDHRFRAIDGIDPVPIQSDLSLPIA